MHERQRWIAYWWEKKALPTQQVPLALRLAGVPPSRREWRLWINRLLLWLGVAALSAGLIFFVAANWSGMGRFFKFALAESAIIASLAAYVFFARFRHGNAALLAASLAVGALLALIGQTYQTSADTFELFAVWALLVLPWVLLARLPTLWVLWLVLLHVAYVFYLKTFDTLWGFSLKNENAFVVPVLLNGGALLLWEWLAAQGRKWMHGRWVARLLSLALSVVATALAIYLIIDTIADTNEWYFSLYLLVLAGIYTVYRHKAPDIFMLAAGALSLIVVLTTGLGRVLWELTPKSATFNLFLLGLFPMLAAAGAAWWLRRVGHGLKSDRSEATQPEEPKEVSR